LGFNKKTLQALKRSFKILWRSGLSKKEACDTLMNNYAELEEIKNLVNFIKTSDRGVISPREKK
jgi:UDP-N-acetylglucosamine acyltransferase